MYVLCSAFVYPAAVKAHLSFNLAAGAYVLLKSAMGIVEALDLASSHLPSSMINKSVLMVSR